MKLAVLGSGSRGNSVLIETADTRVLVDAGFAARDLALRLARLGYDADAIDAIVITHDHGDHTRGMGVFARRHGTPLHLTDGTRQATAKLLRGGERVVPYRAGFPFEIGSVRVEPFVTLHDAADPVGIALSDLTTGCRVGIATDLGRPNAGIRHALSNCHLLVLEANHDELLLQQAPYPESVRARIRSSHGHLSNEAAARFATELLHEGLCAVVLAHLSRESNDPGRALSTVSDALAREGFRGVIDVASQDEPGPVYDVADLRRRHAPEQLGLL